MAVAGITAIGTYDYRGLDTAGHLYSVRNKLRQSSFRPPSPFPWPRANPVNTSRSSAHDTGGALEPSGNRDASAAGSPMALGRTGITVRISDLIISADDTRTVLDGKIYRLPQFTRAGKAEITGTDEDEKIDISQDQHGNTIIAASARGEQAEINLGRIAALRINTGGGNDQVDVKVTNYYGGITIDGHAGDNSISVDAGNVMHTGITISGGAGNDNIILSGQAVKILVDGVAGNNLIDARGMVGGTAFNRELRGGSGNDLIYGADGGNTIRGGAGNDLIVGGRGDDRLYGEDGDDIIYGRHGRNFISGGAGNDTLYGGSGNDIIRGDAGNDTLVGGAGDDYLDGGSGSDRLYAGAGRDILRGGGEGSNTFAPMHNSPDEIYAVGRTTDYLKVMTRFGLRRQPIITDYQNTAKLLLDYDHTKDYLVDLSIVE